jgi:hypothetical protein
VTDSQRMVSFTTSVNPMVKDNVSQHLNNLITDHIEMFMEDYHVDDEYVDFTEMEA